MSSEQPSTSNATGETNPHDDLTKWWVIDTEWGFSSFFSPHLKLKEMNTTEVSLSVVNENVPSSVTFSWTPMKTALEWFIDSEGFLAVLSVSLWKVILTWENPLYCFDVFALSLLETACCPSIGFVRLEWVWAPHMPWDSRRGLCLWLRRERSGPQQIFCMDSL